MADVQFDHEYKRILSDRYTGQTFKAMLIMTSTTLASERTIEFLGDASTVDEFNPGDSSYVPGFNQSGRKNLTLSVTVDTVNHKASLSQTGNYVEWPSLSNSSRMIAGCAWIREGTSDLDTEIIRYYELAIPVNPNGVNFRFTFASSVLDIRDIVAA